MNHIIVSVAKTLLITHRYNLIRKTVGDTVEAVIVVPPVAGKREIFESLVLGNPLRTMVCDDSVRKGNRENGVPRAVEIAQELGVRLTVCSSPRPDWFEADPKPGTAIMWGMDFPTMVEWIKLGKFPWEDEQPQYNTVIHDWCGWLGSKLTTRPLYPAAEIREGLNIIRSKFKEE